MKLFTIFQPYEVTNTYLLHQDGEKNAVIIDPGRFDLNLLNLVEEHNLYISHVLLTHSHILKTGFQQFCAVSHLSFALLGPSFPGAFSI